jgi:cephalosporin hydroxylase
MSKCPLDMCVSQEILYERRPDIIVETGTEFGGSALLLADICELSGCGRTEDVCRSKRLELIEKALKEQKEVVKLTQDCLNETQDLFVAQWRELDAVNSERLRIANEAEQAARRIALLEKEINTSNG